MIVIDSVSYDVPILRSPKIKAETLYKTAERTADGKLHSQLIGVYFNFYGVAFGSVYDSSLYTSLWRKITEPVEYHSITLYDESGEYTFDAYFSGIESALKKVENGITYWSGLTMNVIAISPARIP
jgi:hypothetical protein